MISDYGRHSKILISEINMTAVKLVADITSIRNIRIGTEKKTHIIITRAIRLCQIFTQLYIGRRTAGSRIHLS